MKVLIVTYYWPPAGGPGVQRWLKFVKYLRYNGVEPVVFTAENPVYPLTDVTLEKDIPEGTEVIKCRITEPNAILSKFKKSNVQNSMGFLNPNPSLFEKLLLYIRANFFIPDARMFWVKPSVRKLERYLEENKVDALITTGPPYSVHLIGWHLKKRLAIKWIADFRDPWTSVDYFHLLPLSQKAIKKHYYLENLVVRDADSVLMVSNHAKQKYKDKASLIDVITNGYDEDNDFVKEDTVIDSKFTLTYIGMMSSERNPKVLWEVLSEISENDSNFRDDFVLRFIGKIDDTVSKSLKESNIKNIEKIGYVPHNDAKRFQRKSQVLLIVVNDYPSAKEMIPGKTFEYLQARRPILGIAPTEGDLADIIRETKSGEVFSYHANKIKLRSYILKLYKCYKNEGIDMLTEDISQFHRKKLTEKLVTFIHKTIKN